MATLTLLKLNLKFYHSHVFVEALFIVLNFSEEAQMKKKILFVLTSHDKKGETGQPTGFYLSEASHPWSVLKSNGFAIDFVSPKGGKAPMDGVDLDDLTNRTFLEDPEVSEKINATVTPADINVDDYAAILFVGGHGTMWDFPQDQRLAQIAADIYEAGGVVSAVCHGPSALINVKLKNGDYLINGKQVAAFTNEEERAVALDSVVPFLLADTLEERGAIHKPAANWQPNVVVDGRLITGQNPASATALGSEIARALQP